MSTRKTKGATKTPAFVARAERAFARVARKVRVESRRSGLPAVVFSNESHKPEKGEERVSIVSSDPDLPLRDSVIARLAKATWDRALSTSP